MVDEAVFDGVIKRIKKVLVDRKISDDSVAVVSVAIPGRMDTESGKIIENDPFCALIEEYPDCVVDYCLVICGQSCRGCNEHRMALASACRKLFVEDNDEVIWNYDVGKANAKPVSADVLFAPVDESGDLNYRKAFLCPPYENGYTDADFDKVNAALFPKGTDSLQVFEWTTDWSEYFDEGHEWWGALCYTVYDATLDRFAVILASATD